MIYIWDNPQVSPKSMFEISETDLYHTNQECAKIEQKKYDWVVVIG